MSSGSSEMEGDFNGGPNSWIVLKARKRRTRYEQSGKAIGRVLIYFCACPRTRFC